MTNGINRQWLLAKRPEGKAEEAKFRWAEGPIPSPADGQALVRNLWISFHPTALLSISAAESEGGMPIGGVMQGDLASQVIESRLPGFEPGDLVQGFAGWEDYSAIDGQGFIPARKFSPDIPPNLALGTLGVTGMAAYFGVLEVGRPRAGETFVVSAAAGGVGSVAAQIAKIQGLRVIGIAGGKEKCDWLLHEVGLDGVIDHRSEDVGKRLDELCPQGIDIYFDNVGGAILDEALARLRQNGRVVLCGGTSRYGKNPQPPGPQNYLALVMINGRMEGILAKDYLPRFPEAVAAMRGWLRSGQLKSKDDIVVGLENAPAAFARNFTGANVGKQLLKIADPPLPLRPEG
ncbi:MAG TPA: NADP-dependent oxidoreductase [Thermoplasmata archaeon]|nr:NADP-dependent oxidoreductase [Thermoplasmata archaeon]